MPSSKSATADETIKLSLFAGNAVFCVSLSSFVVQHGVSLVAWFLSRNLQSKLLFELATSGQGRCTCPSLSLQSVLARV